MTREWSYRLRDLALASLGLALVAPLLLVVAAAIWLTDGRPVFFTQARPGRFGSTYRLVKFRTMREETAPGESDAQRITRIGAVLRATSVDELPELINVVKGEMALVGPRPLLDEYLVHYTGEQHLRHQVRPGLTGLAQVSGRNSISWQERLQLDIDYVRHRSHWGDVKILARTVLCVFTRSGINHPGHATMPRLDRGSGS